MPLIYITGIAGAGKSTVRNELKRRGFETYGTDEDDLAGFYNVKTGTFLGNDIPAEVRTEEWRRQYAWKVPREAMERLAQRAKDKPVFVCGVALNEDEYKDLFSQVITLNIDTETLVQRIHDRPEDSYGKLDHELRDILEWQQGTPEEYRRSGATLVDATQPIEAVVDDILKLSGVTR